MEKRNDKVCYDMAMDEAQKTQNPPQVQPQNPGSIVREVERPVSDYASEKSPEISEELQKIVETTPDKPQIDKVNEQMGVKPSLESVSIPAQPSTGLVLPKAKELQKEASSLPTLESRRWEIEKEIREISKAQKKAA